MIEYIDLKIDFTNRNARVGGVTLDRVTTRSYDTAIKFRIEIIGHTLDDTYDVKILTKYHESDFKVMTTLGDSLEIVDGKIIYTPKVNLITEADYVRNYLYLSKDGLGLDMAQFNYQVDVSQIGEITLDIRQAYDESYETLITEFEQALEDYKLTLPQASELRAEIDVVLNQFGVDSQAKLNQYDDDAQQVIADNQTAFGLAESGRQDSYEQAESDRGAVFEQAVTDWEQGAEVAFSGKISEFGNNGNQAITDFNSTSGGILSTIESNESGRLSSEATRETSETARLSAEATRKTAETDRVSSETTRKTNETTRISNENARKSAEVIRLASEVDRVNAENVRSDFYEGFDGRLDDLESDKVVLKNLVKNGDFSQGENPWAPIGSGVSSKIEAGALTVTTTANGVRIATPSTTVIGHKYYLSVKKTWSETVAPAAPHFYIDNIVPVLNLGTSSSEETLSAVITSTVNGYQLSIYPRNTNAVLKLDNIVFLDLTATFGASNEPTKSEMDELIKITGYFDEVTSTQILTWQLKLMRQNRNALIALGGTII